MLDDLFIDIFKMFFVISWILFFVLELLEIKKQKEIKKNLELNIRILKDLNNRF